MDLHEFENLPPDQQEQIFHKSSFKDKADLILHSHNPGALTRSLSQEELYLLTREMDIEERSEVIRYASLPQLFFISDVDCWHKDRLDRKSFVQWLETLLAADEKKLLAWLLEMDYEAVVAGFYQLIQVMKPDHEWTADDILGDTPYFTLDQMYYIFVGEENFQTVKRSIEVLFENHRGRYVAILEGLMGELEDELEEEAYNRREARLAERGFPDFETAHKIYRPLTKEEYENFPLKNALRNQELRDKESAVPNYLVLWSSERFFLDDVLHSFQNDDRSVRDSLQEELAWISNKVIACEGIDFSSEDKVREGIERARGLINIGLELLSGGDFEKARQVLQERWLELVFRWGATHVNELKDRARTMIRDYWKTSQVDFLNFLDPPYDLILTGLLRNPPAVYDDTSKEPESLRYFKTGADTERVWRAVIQLEKIHELLFDGLKKNFDKAKKESLDGEQGFTLFGFLGGLLAQWILSKKISYASIPVDSVGVLVNDGFEVRGDQRILKNSYKEGFIKDILPDSEREVCLPFFSLFFDRFEDEVGGLKDTRNIEPQFVSILKIQSGKNPPSKTRRGKTTRDSIGRAKK